METTITPEQAAELVRKNKNGTIFSVTFFKRSTGTLRRMVCRTGVKQGVTGEGKKFNDRDHNLLTVYELVTNPETTRGAKGQFVGGGNMAKQWRHVAVEGIRKLKIGGKSYNVVGQ